MNIFQFLRLIHNIYGKKSADIKYIESLGLLAVKIGQVHALRPDFLSESKCRELSVLYRHTEPAEGVLIDKYLNESKRQNLKDNLAYIEKIPFASASVGQVHRGALLNGQEVVVKIIKKDNAESFRKDVAAVRRFFNWVIKFYPPLRGVANPLGLLRDIEKMTLTELDLKNEISGAKILSQIADKYRSQFDLTRLKFPHVYEEYSDSEVLVTEWIEGETLDEMLENGKCDYDLLLQLFRDHGLYLFIEGTFHGDLHPGNVIVKDNCFYFVDSAYIGRVSDKLRLGLFNFFDTLSKFDYIGSAKNLHAMSDNTLSEGDYKIFEKKFIELYADFTNTTVSQMSLTKKMMQTIRLGVLSGMNFNEGIFDIIKSLMYLDGMVLRANPSAVLLKDMRQYIDEFNSVKRI